VDGLNLYFKKYIIHTKYTKYRIPVDIFWNSLMFIPCIIRYSRNNSGLGSSVGIATGYGLHGLGDQIPVGTQFFAHIQTGPGAHPDSCTMGTGSFLGVKWPGCGADHPPTLLARRLRMSRAIPLLPL
jgi:hypothetical protein